MANTDSRFNEVLKKPLDKIKRPGGKATRKRFQWCAPKKLVGEIMSRDTVSFRLVIRDFAAPQDGPQMGCAAGALALLRQQLLPRWPGSPGNLCWGDYFRTPVY
jgi:hypothetical protein